MKTHRVLIVIALATSIASSQPFQQPLSSVSSGGGRVSGGSLVLSSSIGLPAAPSTTSAGFGLRSGFINSLRLHIASLKTVTGIKFNDIDANGVFGGTDTTLPGWGIFLKDSLGAVIESTITASSGGYQFTNVPDGYYTLSEKPQAGWIETYPSAGTHSFTLSHGRFPGMKNFGNTFGVSYTGGSGGTWSDPSHWAGNHVPDAQTAVIIPPNTGVIVDVLPSDTVRALRVSLGSSLNFSNAAGQLKVTGTAQIDDGASVVFPSSSDTTGLTVFGSLVNGGTIDPGHSTVILAGDNPKSISNLNPGNNPDRNTFYNLAINGDNTTTAGNVVVSNTLTVNNRIVPGTSDTVKILSGSVSALAGSGTIARGSVRRTIVQGETGTYRFERPSTYLKFNGAGTYPEAVTMTTAPASTSPAYSLNWIVVGGTVDTVNNVVAFDSATHFSKWAIGKPKPTFTSVGTPQVDRSYTIDASGGSGFTARISLSYDQSEVPYGTTESSLQLLKGPLITDTVQQGWNMIAVPGVADDTLKTDLYPAAVSQAFAYNGTYQQKQVMKFGEGYWLKYAATQPISVAARDMDHAIIQVHQGWNMIGSLSFPLPANGISPVAPVALVSKIYGYSGGTGYTQSAMLLPGRAYWAKASSAGNLLLSAEPSTMKPLASPMPRSERSEGASPVNSLTLTDGEGRTRTLTFGRFSDADLAEHELPPPPPAGTFDVRFSSGRDAETIARGTDRPMPVLVSTPAYPVKVRWHIADVTLSPSLHLNGRKIPMKGGGNIQLMNDESLALSIGSLPSAGTPRRYSLEQNYPNPFNPATVIRYSLPARSRVAITVYNIIGQRVATLVEEVQEAGERSVTWDASGFPSGVYCYRIDSGEFHSMRKMLLVR